MGDNVTRWDEWFSVRAMRHVFHVKPNTSEQGWATVLQPVLKCSYPMQYVLTLESVDELLPEQVGKSPGWRHSPERWHSRFPSL